MQIQIRLYDFSTQWSMWDVGTILNLTANNFWKVTTLLSYFRIERCLQEGVKYGFVPYLKLQLRISSLCAGEGENYKATRKLAPPPPPKGSGRVAVRPR